jgi:SAM-dependent methyltransferase
MDPTAEEIRASVRERFANLARSPRLEKAFPAGPESAKTLGYPADVVDSLPPSVTESFAGVGNPFSLGDVAAGQTVLDLGCGAGLDSILAARQSGPSGQVIGIDMTREMIDKARANADLLGLTNIEFRLGDAESLPVVSGTVDVAISNGVFNLCPDKPRVLAEVLRVLRPGGRLMMADILLEDHVTPEEVKRRGTWSG